jgi:hypothetical protein
MGVVTRLVGQVHQQFPAPACISEYNKHMQGVDRLDQLRAKYSIADGHSMQKWHLKLALAFIDIARVNAYVTKRMRDNYKSLRNPHQDFMAELASEMISGRWKETADDGGVFIADMVRTATGNVTPSPSTPVTPTPSESTCQFVLSSKEFPDATRGKRGCKVCLFEGRVATMKTNYCINHNICLCTGNYPIQADLAHIVCSEEGWSCWRKFHEFYLPQGLYNSQGRIKRSSKIFIQRRELNLSQAQLNRDLSTSLDQFSQRLELPSPSSSDDTQGSSFASVPPNASSRVSFCRALNMDTNETETPPVGSYTTLLLGATPDNAASLISPPTLVMPPFDGALANAV